MDAGECILNAHWHSLWSYIIVHRTGNKIKSTWFSWHDKTTLAINPISSPANRFCLMPIKGYEI